MSDATRAAVEEYWRRMNTNEWQVVGQLLHDNFVLDWPQSGERIRGRNHFAAVNANYPAAGPWRFAVQRVVTDDNAAATDVLVSAPTISARVVTFFELRDGRIWRMTEFWPDPFEAATWRSQWAERYEPDEASGG
ncbi:MAG TPA: nuclear transport factor 2 family protein [Ktedonobacterales bacterium]